jgi:hypothetical protein
VAALGNVRPYDTISTAIKALAKWLRRRNNFPPEKTVNVWFTGHSLGCATASLVYSRFLMRHKDMGIRSVLRDAYLFAAPIVCDRDTVESMSCLVGYIFLGVAQPFGHVRRWVRILIWDPSASLQRQDERGQEAP